MVQLLLVATSIPKTQLSTCRSKNGFMFETFSLVFNLRWLSSNCCQQRNNFSLLSQRLSNKRANCHFSLCNLVWIQQNRYNLKCKLFITLQRGKLSFHTNIDILIFNVDEKANNHVSQTVQLWL